MKLSLILVIVTFVMPIIANNENSYQAKWISSLMRYLLQHSKIAYILKMIKHNVTIHQEKIRLKIIFMVRGANSEESIDLENSNFRNDQLFNKPYYGYSQRSIIDLTIYFVDYQQEISQVIERVAFTLHLSGNLIGPEYFMYVTPKI